LLFLTRVHTDLILMMQLVCACGRTVYEPPIPCGTVMQCHYPCLRPRTTCEHQNTSHGCHDEGIPCPPCPHLANKVCACGKKVVPNVRCSLETEKVSCGTVCGKLMGCGYHTCERLCHSDPCGPCVATCGKLRMSCLPNHHPCTRPCHAPASCPDTDPCQSLVTLTCPCGRIKQSVPCGRTASSSRGTPLSSQAAATPKCTNDCQIAKRNARLADALGIGPDSRSAAGANVVYNDELVGFARANAKFLGVVERAFSDFITSEKRTQVLPHMPPERRKFVHDLAAVYRMDTQMVDQEPHRSVQLLRRLDTRIPVPVLSAHLASSAAPPSLGKLADLRSLRGSTTSAGSASFASTSGWRSGGGGLSAGSSVSTASKSATPVGQRGWASVIAKPTPVPAVALTTSATPPPSQSRSLTPLSRTRTPVGTAAPSGSGVGTRTGSPAPPQPVPVSSELVPDSWEDDV